MKTAQPASTTDLLDLVVRSGIYQPADFDQRVARIPGLPTDPLRAANILVESGVLTRFQAKHLLTGKYKGFKVGKYVVRDVLGKGGMGTVYLAEHQGLRRSVALKILAPVTEANTRVAVERFLREARAAAALDHPNIVRIYDAGESGDLRYLVMEHVDGVTLDALLARGGPVTPSRAVAYVAQAAAGLQHAYERGFVHRDIKPGNLILAKDGVIKILDMGLQPGPTGSARDRGDLRPSGGRGGGGDGGLRLSSGAGAGFVQGGHPVRHLRTSLGATFFALVTGETALRRGSRSQAGSMLQMRQAPGT